jgi:8-oxo-dGTP pyrophosphatase MutT (NUDIX family)
MPGSDPAPDPVPVRDAATVMLVRDAVDDQGGPAVEVCMLRRNLNSEFVAGAYVFPGGAVDPEDRGPEAERLCRGLTDAEASAVLGLGSGGLAFWVAVVRECFEEAGVLVVRRRSDADAGRGEFLDTTDPDTARRFAVHRDAVNAGTARLLDICRDEDLVLAADTVHYVSRWVTPELAPRRYDTRFFVTVAPPGQVAHHDDDETIATIWVRPAEALAQGEAGQIQLLPPTVANLRSIEPFSTAADVMAWAAGISDVVTVLPVVVIDDDGYRVLRPGDDGYAEALAERESAGAPDQETLSEARRAWNPRTGSA